MENGEWKWKIEMKMDRTMKSTVCQLTTVKLASGEDNTMPGIRARIGQDFAYESWKDEQRNGPSGR